MHKGKEGPATGFLLGPAVFRGCAAALSRGADCLCGTDGRKSRAERSGNPLDAPGLADRECRSLHLPRRAPDERNRKKEEGDAAG